MSKLPHNCPISPASTASNTPKWATTPTLEIVTKAKSCVEIQIHDRVYDITRFIHTHPGGSIIMYYANQDATDAYEAFHYRNPKAAKYLKTLPSRPAGETPLMTDERSIELLNGFRALRRKLIKEGYFNVSYMHVAIRLCEVALLFFLHFYLISMGHIWSAAIIGGLAGGRSGWVQHEAGHRSLTGRRYLDDFIQKLYISFGLIVYNGRWNNMHNRHHATPQKEEYDPDVDTLPMVAFYRLALCRGRRSGVTMKYFRWWIQYQHITFFFFSTVFNVFFWHFYLHPRDYLIRKFEPLTLLLVISRYAATCYAASSLYSIPQGIAIVWMTSFFAGVYLFTNFSLNHTYLPTIRADDEKNWVDYQIGHTVNIISSPLVNWWMGFLNCQIEHHLFPQMPQFRQPSIVPYTKKFCEEYGLEYQEFTYWQAMKFMIGNLRCIANDVNAIYEQICLTDQCSKLVDGAKASSMSRQRHQPTAADHNVVLSQRMSSAVKAAA